MPQLFLSLLVASTVLFASDHRGAATANPQNEATTITVGVNLVLLPVTVTDRNGRSFRRLKGENFRIFENGQEQVIQNFSTDEIPISMGLVLDRSSSMAERLDQVYSAAYQSIEASKPEDDFFIITFNDSVRVEQGFTSNKDLLREQLNVPEARGQTALYDAIEVGLDVLAQGGNARKALLVITDGDDNSSQSSFRELLQRAAKEDVLIYTIGLYKFRLEAGKNWPIMNVVRWLFENGPRFGDDQQNLKKRLKQLSETTSARAYFPRTPKECELANIAIAEELRQQYLFGFYPKAEGRQGAWHTIEVRLQSLSQPLPKHLTVRTRPGYFTRGSNLLAGTSSNR